MTGFRTLIMSRLRLIKGILAPFIFLVTLSNCAFSQLEENIGNWYTGDYWESLSISRVDHKNFKMDFQDHIGERNGKVSVTLSPTEASQLVSYYYQAKSKSLTLNANQKFDYPSVRGIQAYACGGIAKSLEYPTFGIVAKGQGQTAWCSFTQEPKNRKEYQSFEALLSKIASARKQQPGMPRQPD